MFSTHSLKLNGQAIQIEFEGTALQLIRNQLDFCLLVVILSSQERVGGAVVLPHSWR